MHGTPVVLRDQAPLHEGNMDLQEGWTLEDFVEQLNQRVFFWPGTEDGPIDYGLRHFGRYASERPHLIRVRLASLLAANPGAMAQFCRYNSGSPRCVQGRRSPRSERTFLDHADVDFQRNQVVEVTFRGEVGLPFDAELGDRPGGPWMRLFEDDIRHHAAS